MPKCGFCKTPTKNKIGLKTLCSIDCAIDYGRQQREKRERREIREAKKRIKTLSQVCSDAQRDVNRYIVLRDKMYWGKCISCGEREITDAGHFYHAGSKYRTSRIRFDYRVIHGQCGHCNRFSGGGNHEGFRAGLLRRYGNNYLSYLEGLKQQADSGTLLPLAKDEVFEIAAKARRDKRELEKEAI